MLRSIQTKLPLGQRHLSMVKNWIPSGLTYLIGTATLGLYFTDWKVVNRYIPFYGSKFPEVVEEES